MLQRNSLEISTGELNSLIILIKNIYGFDFENYSVASLKRRFIRFMNDQKLSCFDLSNRLTNDAEFFECLLKAVTVNVTDMFRDPYVFRYINSQIIPYLSSYPHIKIWSAGCSTGEELYSMAILLTEGGLYDRSFLYGTDINSEVLASAKKGIYNLKKMKVYSANYLEVCGKKSLSQHYTANYDAALINRSLKKNVLFSFHNLVSDAPFNEFQIILCRNVLIYFNTDLQETVIRLLYNSLANLGFLCLGSKETIRNTEWRKKFRLVDQKSNIYQKIS